MTSQAEDMFFFRSSHDTDLKGWSKLAHFKQKICPGKFKTLYESDMLEICSIFQLYHNLNLVGYIFG